MVEITRGPADPNRAARFKRLADEVDAAIRAQDMPRAVAGAERAVKEGFGHPGFFNLLAYRDLTQGRYREAIALLRNGLTMAPQDANLLNLLGVAHNHLQEYRDAIGALDTAITAFPDFAPPFYNRGLSFEGLGDLGRAHADFERAATLQPNYPDALSRLAYAETMRGRHALALGYAERALAANPRDALGRLASAMAEVALGRFEAAIARLTVLLRDPELGNVNRAIASGLLGDALDGAGQYTPAFEAYAASGDLLRQIYAPSFGADHALQSAQMLRRYFEQAAPEAWAADRAAGAQDGVLGHVFLVGFPRSGTTLLEQTLAGHPDVVTSEERDLLADAAHAFARSPADLDTLAALTPAMAAQYREMYWKRAAAAGLDAKGRVFVDKLPLNALLLPLVAKLFPTAKILFALRDPRDVVFSCFRRRFAMSNQMYQLVTLDGAARYYDVVMGACAAYREQLGLDWHDVRHEDFVADYEPQVRALCDRLGLAWTAGMTQVAERLRARAVDTPSSGQIAKGVSEEGVGAWRHYAQPMADVLPLLAPWAARFGYED
ncbi:MAG: sulfotransferase [Rhizomicrobium sp.]